MSKAILPNDVERRFAALSAGLDKLRGGDFEGAMAEVAKTQVTAETLSFLKKTKGADWIRKYNFDTTRADKKYGSGWLDQ